MSKKPKPPIALYSALADATRCRILELLRAGPMPVHVLTQAFAISRPAISRHLRVLKTAGLVAEVKKGRENVYAFKAAKLDAGMKWIDQLAGPIEVEASDVAEPAATAAAKPKEPKVRPAAKVAPVAKSAPEAQPEQPKEKKPATKKAIFKDADPEAPAAAPSISQMGFDF